MTGERVLGVDACKGGWIGIVLSGSEVAAHAATTIEQLFAAATAAGPVEVVAIDMPIGLPDSGPRSADLLARAVIGPRRSSVFITPVRAALLAPDHASATAINREATGAGVSAQAFALRSKLLEVDEWVRGAATRVVEVHPEVSFASLAGAPLAERKTSWAGAVHRRQLLADAGIRLDDDLGPAGSAGAIDDVLDAAVAAWTARRVARGLAHPLPDPPESFRDGIPCAIWV
jgi:predicted RNase H-like nuclease